MIVDDLNDRRLPDSGAMPPARFGLCDTCRHQRIVRSGRGSVFSLCRRSTSDDRYPKYPRVPVLECPGHEVSSAADRA